MHLRFRVNKGCYANHKRRKIAAFLNISFNFMMVQLSFFLILWLFPLDNMSVQRCIFIHIKTGKELNIGTFFSCLQIVFHPSHPAKCSLLKFHAFRNPDCMNIVTSVSFGLPLSSPMIDFSVDLILDVINKISTLHPSRKLLMKKEINSLILILHPNSFIDFRDFICKWRLTRLFYVHYSFSLNL